jgi:hypothetical protein
LPRCLAKAVPNWGSLRRQLVSPQRNQANRSRAKENAVADLAGSRSTEGEEVDKNFLPEERVIWRKRFHAECFDFRGKSLFTRFDDCEFVKCELLFDQDTEHLAFTGCVFKDCNIDQLKQDEKRGLQGKDNFFDRPLEQRRAEFEKRLAQVLADRAKLR